MLRYMSIIHIMYCKEYIEYCKNTNIIRNYTEVYICNRSNVI